MACTAGAAAESDGHGLNDVGGLSFKEVGKDVVAPKVAAKGLHQGLLFLFEKGLRLVGGHGGGGGGSGHAG